MTSQRPFPIARALGALVLASIALPSAASAHCDTMDGPVVKAARQALATGNVALALVWVRPQDEVEIRDAFSRARDVRALSPEARTLADLWFFETLVRVHRQGEGVPYTGLKPAGTEPSPGIAAADSAVALGSVDALARSLGGRAADAVRTRFARVQALSGYGPDDIAAGRAYVAAYVEFIHFVEELDALLEHGASGHAPESPPGEIRHH